MMVVSWVLAASSVLIANYECLFTRPFFVTTNQCMIEISVHDLGNCLANIVRFASYCLNQ
jgi:hypothetical protein